MENGDEELEEGGAEGMKLYEKSDRVNKCKSKVWTRKVLKNWNILLRLQRQITKFPVKNKKWHKIMLSPVANLYP